MRRLLSFGLILILALSSNSLFAQSLPADYLQEIRQTDPRTAAELTRAIQSGNFDRARDIVETYRKKQKQADETAEVDLEDMDPETLAEFNRAVENGDFEKAQKIIERHKKIAEMQKRGLENGKMPSLFERTLAGDFPADVSTSLTQFGYDVFEKAVAEVKLEGRLRAAGFLKQQSGESGQEAARRAYVAWP